MMQFFGTIVTKEDKVNLELDEGDIFNLTSAVIHPKSEGKGKVYLVAVISLIDEDEMDNSDDEEEEQEREDEIEIPICVLEPGKIEQVSLNLHFNFEQIVRFELQGTDGSANAVALSGTVITMEQQGDCQDDDCEDDQCGLSHEHDEEIDSDEEFGFESDDEDVDQDDEEIPQLIAPKKGNAKITEIKAEPVVKQQPTKQAKQTVSTPDKAAAAAPKQSPAVKQQPKQAPAKPQANQSKNAPKQSPAKPQQAAAKQSPAKPAENNKKRQQPQNENNKKKSKN